MCVICIEIYLSLTNYLGWLVVIACLNFSNILLQMRQCLEVRLAAAENEIKSALLKKLEKEEVTRKSLVEQELIMEQVVQESKILRQHAEDNVKVVTTPF